MPRRLCDPDQHERDRQRVELLATHVRVVAAGLYDRDRAKDLQRMAVELEASVIGPCLLELVAS